MEIGDTVTFAFGKSEKKGVVYKIHPKTVYIKCDFDNHKSKIIKRKIAKLNKEK